MPSKSCDTCYWDDRPVFDEEDGDLISPCHDCDYSDDPSFPCWKPKAEPVTDLCLGEVE
jgi:hypothetical protein